MYTTVTQIREAFWQHFPRYQDQYRKGKRQNDYSADIRQSFCFWIDELHRDGSISDKLAKTATL